MHETILKTFHVVHFENGSQFGRGGYVYIIEYTTSNEKYTFRIFNDTVNYELIVQQINDNEVYDLGTLKTEFTAPERMIEFIIDNIVKTVVDSWGETL